MTIVKKEPFSLDWKGNVLEMSRDMKVVRRYDFDKVPSELDVNFLKFGKQTKLSNFKAGAKEAKRDPVEMMDEGFSRMCDGFWNLEREGIVKVPMALILLVVELLDDSANGNPCSKEDAEVSLRTQKDTWPALEAAHKQRLDEIRKELAEVKKTAVPRDLGTLVAKK
jgi:hypothetical protein